MAQNFLQGGSGAYLQNAAPARVAQNAAPAPVFQKTFNPQALNFNPQRAAYNGPSAAQIARQQQIQAQAARAARERKRRNILDFLTQFGGIGPQPGVTPVPMTVNLPQDINEALGLTGKRNFSDNSVLGQVAREIAQRSGPGKTQMQKLGDMGKAIISTPQNIATNIGDIYESNLAQKQQGELQGRISDLSGKLQQTQDPNQRRILINQMRSMEAGLPAYDPSIQNLPTQKEVLANFGKLGIETLSGGVLKGGSVASAGLRGAANSLPGRAASVITSRAPQVTPGAARVIRGTAAGAGSGAAFGGLDAYGRDQNLSGILKTAVAYGGVGALLGGAIPAAGVIKSRKPSQADVLKERFGFDPAQNPELLPKLGLQGSTRDDLVKEAGGILTDANLKKVKNKGSSTVQPGRALEQAFEDTGAAGKVTKYLETAQNAGNARAVDFERFISSGYVDTMRKAGLDVTNNKKYEALAQFGSGKITFRELSKKVGNKQANIIRDAAPVHQTFFDKLLETANANSDRLGNAAVEKRQGYFPSKGDFKDSRGGEAAFADGLEAVQGPVSSFRHARKGDGDMNLDALNTYFRQLSNEVGRGEAATRHRVFRDMFAMKAKEAGVKEGDISKILTTLDNQTNELSGVGSTRIDLPGGKSLTSQGRPGSLDYITSRNSAAQIGASASSTMVQAVNYFPSLMRNPVKTLKATADELQSVMGTLKDDAAERSDFLRARLAKVDEISPSMWKRALDAGFIPLRAVEGFTAKVVWRTRYADNLKKGMAAPTARETADTQVKREIASRAPGDKPGVYRLKGVTGTVVQFTLEPSNALTNFNHLIKKGKLKEAAAIAFGYGLYNQLTENIVGYRAALDPLNAGYEAGSAVAEGKPSEAVGRVLGEYAGQRPGGPILGEAYGAAVGDKGANIAGVNLPAKEAFFGESQLGRFGAAPASSALVKGFNFSKDDEGKVDWDPVRGFAELGIKLGLPAGGGQVLKAHEGNKAVNEGVYKSRKGNELFKVDDTPGNRIRAGLFGKSSLPETQNFFDKMKQDPKAALEAAFKEKNIQLATDFANQGKDIAAGAGVSFSLNPDEQAVSTGFVRKTKPDKNGNSTTYLIGDDEAEKAIMALPENQQLPAARAYNKLKIAKDAAAYQENLRISKTPAGELLPRTNPAAVRDQGQKLMNSLATLKFPDGEVSSQELKFVSGLSPEYQSDYLRKLRETGLSSNIRKADLLPGRVEQLKLTQASLGGYGPNSGVERIQLNEAQQGVDLNSRVSSEIADTSAASAVLRRKATAGLSQPALNDYNTQINALQQQRILRGIQDPFSSYVNLKAGDPIYTPKRGKTDRRGLSIEDILGGKVSFAKPVKAKKGRKPRKARASRGRKPKKVSMTAKKPKASSFKAKPYKPTASATLASLGIKI